MLLLKSLKLNDFLSHRESLIEFRPDCQLLVDGTSGSGKSACIEGIVFALYGRGRIDNRSLVRHGAKAAKVDLQLDLDGAVFNVSRSVTDKGTHTVAISVLRRTEKDGDWEWQPVGVAGVKECQAYIEKHITHASYELFVNSACHMQENPDSFVKQTASKRKELLLEIVGVDFIDEAADKCKKALSERENKLAVLSGSSASDEMTLANAAGQVAALEKEEPLADALNEADRSTMVAESESQTALQAVQGSAQELNTLKAEAFTLAKEITALEGIPEAIKVKQNGLTVVDGAKACLVKELAAKEAKDEWQRNFDHFKALYPRTPELLKLKETEETLNAELIQLMSEKVDLCPETNVKCPLVMKVHEAKKARLEKDLVTVTAERAERDREKAEIDAKIVELGVMPSFDPKALAAWNETVSSEGRLMAEIAALSTRFEALEAKKGRQAEIEARITVLGDVDKAFAAANLNLAAAKEAHQRAYTAKVRYESDMAQLANCREAVARLKEKMAQGAVDKSTLTLECGRLTMLKEALGANGIRAVAADHAIPQLENRINDVLSQLSDFRVRLDTQKDALSEDKKKEGLFITIINGEGSEMDLECYSGGERSKIVMSISEALAEMQNASFRILDEEFMALDQESLGQFASILMSFKSKASQMVCISHIQTIKDMFSDKITVTKKDGVSQVN